MSTWSLPFDEGQAFFIARHDRHMHALATQGIGEQSACPGLIHHNDHMRGLHRRLPLSIGISLDCHRKVVLDTRLLATRIENVTKRVTSPILVCFRVQTDELLRSATPGATGCLTGSTRFSETACPAYRPPGLTAFTTARFSRLFLGFRKRAANLAAEPAAIGAGGTFAN